MRTVRITANTTASADAAYLALSQLDDDWRVPFRDRAIGWTQRCALTPHQRRITFVQEAGDLASLSGSWQVTPTTGGCEVRFVLSYDVGAPIYDRILDPLIEQQVTEVARTVIAGLAP